MDKKITKISDEELKKYLNKKFKEYYEKDTWDCNIEVNQRSFDFGYFRAIEDILSYLEKE